MRSVNSCCFGSTLDSITSQEDEAIIKCILCSKDLFTFITRDNLFRKQSSQLASVLLIVVVFVFHQWTPLHVGAQRGRCEKVLGYLVKHGANLDTKDNNGVRTYVNILVSTLVLVN